MGRDITAEFSALFADRIRLPTRIEELRRAYRNTTPFPHVVIDDLFSPAILDSVLEEMAGLDDSKWLLVESPPHERIRRMRSAVELGAAGSQLVSLLHGASFLYLLSEITGIWQLLPDPYLQGAGYASMKRGDFFNVHSDRNVAYDTGLSRRLAMIVFLNKSWDPNYNGQLELWNDDGTRCDVSVQPDYNRTVIFEVADPNYHGVPRRLPVRRSQPAILHRLLPHSWERGEVGCHPSLLAIRTQLLSRRPSPADLRARGHPACVAQGRQKTGQILRARVTTPIVDGARLVIPPTRNPV